MRSLVGWLVVQAVGRREAVRKAQKDETSSGVQFFNDLDDDALAEFLPAGPRTLIFTEYTDTQEYLLACIEALEAVLRNTHLGADDEQQEYVSKDVRAPILNAIEEDVVPELVTESFSVRQDTEDRGDGLFQPPIGGAEPDDPLPDWLQQWLRSARNAEFSRDVFDEETARPTLAEIIRDIRKTGARVCSDETSRIVDIEEAAGDSDSTIDDPANADLEAEKPSRETGEADPVHAFSPWYQIEPESGMERSSAAAERLRNVVRRPVYTLLSTEVLAEGVNLQECGFIAHYDLPWNPTRLIQRNGRIDRRLNSRFENNEKRETLAEDLETYPAFVKPQQVYHATVVPVEPDFDGERESNYAHKVRKTLRRKLNTIRAIFGLSSWPVVLGPDSAEDVLTGELEFETPGFRRREDLFNTRRQLDKEREAVKERAGDDLSNYRKPELRSGEWINLPLRTDRECVEEILADLVGADTDGVEDSESGGREEGERTPREHFEAAKESWSDVVALCVSTWTPYRPDARPVRARYQLDASTSDEKTGVIQATLIVENREADGGVHLVTWTRVNRDSELGGRNMQDLETFAMTPDNGSKGTDYGFFRYLATLTEPGASTDREVYDRRSEFVPTTPTGFAEDIVARAADGVLSGHCDLPEGAEKSELSFKEDGLRTMAGGSTRSFFPDRVEDERSARADEQSGPGANFYRLLISWLNTVDPVGIGKLDNVLENDEESNIRSLRRTDTLPEGSGEPQFPTEFLPPDGIRTNLWLIPED